MNSYGNRIAAYRYRESPFALARCGRYVLSRLKRFNYPVILSIIAIIFVSSPVITTDPVYFVSVAAAVFALASAGRHRPRRRAFRGDPQASGLQRETRDKDMVIHDMRNLIFAVSGYVTMGKYDKARSKIEEIYRSVSDGGENGDFYALDFILKNLVSLKEQYAKALSISFKSKIALNPSLNVDASDLCAVVGNALDNAIESCRKITDEKRREINFEASSYNDYTIISVSNSISVYVDSELKTTKPNPERHGFGVKSIKSIVDRYEGTFHASQHGDAFTLNLSLKSTKR